MARHILCAFLRFGVLLSIAQNQVYAASVPQNTRPNVIVIVADDMGWNDIGFHGSNQIPTPNIDALAYNGVILNSHYAQALCTPSRSSFLTGKYPIHIGMQHLVILEPEPWGLPLNETVMPEYMKQAGYTTHAIGKWHLGFFKKEYTPTYRGFDTHYGYWNGLQDYYNHNVHATYSNMSGYDMRRNMDVDYSAIGKYSTDLFTEEAVRVIQDHDLSKPMFMYLAHLAPHTGNDDAPLQAPDEEIAKFAHIPDPERRIYAAMVSLLDKSVGTVISALREKHMLENSIIIFMADNGAQTFGVHANHGSNFPLRGMKASLWEGGNKVAATIWSPLIKKPQRVSNQLMHVSDWLPTLYSAIGLDVKDLGKIDGFDMWKVISENATSPRTDIIYNIDDEFNIAAVRRGDYKYVSGTFPKGPTNGWYGDSGLGPLYSYNMTAVITSPVATSLAGVITSRQIEEKHEISPDVTDEPMPFSSKLLTSEIAEEIRNAATLKCGNRDPDQLAHSECNADVSPCLFNLREDPCEMVNIASTRPYLLVSMENIVLQYRATAVKPNNIPEDPRANPIFWNNTWVNWQDYEVVEATKIDWPLSQTAIIIISVLGVLFFAVVMFLVALSIKRRSSSIKLRTNSSVFHFGDDCDNMGNSASVVRMVNDGNQGKEQGFERELQRRDSSKNID